MHTTALGTRSRRAGVGGAWLRRRRSFATTVMLAGVLLSLASYTIYGNVMTTRATVAQSDALTLATALHDARIAVAAEGLHAHEYQAAPSTAVRTRFDNAVESTNRALQEALKVSGADNRARIERLILSHAAYLRAATHLIEMVAISEPGDAQYGHTYVTPAFYTLLHETDKLANRLADVAERRVADLRQRQVRMLVGTVIGFGIGLALVAVIMRIMLGYQRRLARQADMSEHLALHDPLTGLPNRALFSRRLDAMLQTVRLTPAEQLAVIMIDMNGFKAVNDTLGHLAGDELLVEAGRRLLAAVREEDVVARLGGDEFAVLLPWVDAPTAHRIADRIAQALSEDFGLNAGPAVVSGAVGLVLAGADATADELVRRADAAMYHAKNTGCPVALYGPHNDSAGPDRREVVGDMRALLDAGDPGVQLRLYFQPQVRMTDGEVVGVEALARWQHPERGLLMPADFLPAAEHGGLETPLMCHILGVALDHAYEWRAAGRPMLVAVNVSPYSLLHEDFVANVEHRLKARRLPGGTLKLEIPEYAVMSEPQHVIAVMRRLRHLGVDVSIDNFGSGFSSLSQLTRIPAGELKIDRDFIRNLAGDPDNQLLVTGAIKLAHGLSRSVVAEGVEDLDALRVLNALHCDYAQGYALSRPVPADQVHAACAQARRIAREALSLDAPAEGVEARASL